MIRLLADLTVNLPDVTASSSKLQDIASAITGIMAAIAVLIITIAGFKYVLSRGEPQSVAQAKNAIIYAFIGLVVVMSAFGIVTFVLNGL